MEKARKGMIGIYAIRNSKTNDTYVGSSASMNNAFRNHMAALKLGRHMNDALQLAWSKEGPEQFSFVILEVTDDKYSLPIMEERWLAMEKTFSIDNQSRDYLKRLSPCTRLATTKETISELRKLELGTLIETIRILVNYYKKNQNA